MKWIWYGAIGIPVLLLVFGIAAERKPATPSVASPVYDSYPHTVTQRGNGLTLSLSGPEHIEPGEEFMVRVTATNTTANLGVYDGVCMGAGVTISHPGYMEDGPCNPKERVGHVVLKPGETVTRNVKFRPLYTLAEVYAPPVVVISSDFGGQEAHLLLTSEKSRLWPQ